MKEIEVFLKTLSDGLKSLSKGIDGLSKKVDDLAKTEKKRAKGKTAAKTKAKAKKAPAKKTVAAKKTAAAKKKAPAKKKAAPKKKGTENTAFDTVFGLISKSNGGIDTEVLKKKTGFDSKKLANIIYKGKKRGLIKTVSKGKYAKA
jgi:hypothetical protein